MNHPAWSAHQAVSDSHFLQQFEQATLPAALFDHLGHLRAAFLFLERESVILAQRHFASAIQRYAAALGKEPIAPDEASRRVQQYGAQLEAWRIHHVQRFADELRAPRTRH